MAEHVAPIDTSLEAVRRLALAKQHLLGPLPARVTAATALRVVRDLGCLQLDPINVVAPSHRLVLWSRLGNYRDEVLDRLLWRDRTLFEYWGHQASIVLTEDYPLFSGMMRGADRAAPRGLGRHWRRDVDRWVAAHPALRDSVLAELRDRGPLFSSELTGPRPRRPVRGWGSGGDLANMLQILFLRGEVMVAGRSGLQRLWDLPERCLPAWTPREERSVADVEYEAVQRSLKALGVASVGEIDHHFLRHRYPTLRATVARLESESRILRVRIHDAPPDRPRYVHRDDRRQLERYESEVPSYRTTLLSPFDNLICDRSRTEQLFGYRYRFEGYVPKAKREFGPYTLSILHGGALIGRIDPWFDRDRGELRVRGVHAEPRAPRDGATGRAIRDAIGVLAAFLGAGSVRFAGPVPSGWRAALVGRRITSEPAFS